ncbi:MAG TPA: hypothetical protein P5556_07305 [Candidatus Gastranaerophilales bacterium]|nr:hypothetical protein [Candidatus Gastranaerophilales bacterium]
MAFELIFSDQADADMENLKNDKSLEKRLKAVNKALGHLEVNPRHPGLNTHEFTSLTKQYGIKIYEAYAENNTPAAYRIFWHYGHGKKFITIIAVTAHP